jgi:hypothetical protein
VRGCGSIPTDEISLKKDPITLIEVHDMDRAWREDGGEAANLLWRYLPRSRRPQN